MLSLIVFIFIGLIVATIAKALAPGRDIGLGLTILLGTTAQIVAWFASRAIGLERYGQPWLFFLSIAAAVVLLFVFREMGLDERLVRREPDVAGAASAKLPVAGATSATPVADAPPKTESLWRRIALACAWASIGAVMMGMTGFLIGFFGPMRFQPWANQGPMVGIFFTGPAGVLLGALTGGALKLARPGWPTQWRLWALNAATVAYGLVVLDLVVDSSWWH